MKQRSISRHSRTLTHTPHSRSLELPEENPLSYRLVLTEQLDLYSAAKGLWSYPPTHELPSPRATGFPSDELTEALHKALETILTDKQREAVALFFFEGMSQGDIARHLGVSQQVIQKRIYGTVRNGRRVGGALRKLREALAHLVPGSYRSNLSTTTGCSTSPVPSNP